MRLIKFLLKAVIVLVVLVGIAVVVLPMVIDPNDYKAQISEQVTASTGRSFDIDGDIELKTLPWLGVRVNGAKLGNAEGFDAPHFAEVGALDVAVKVMPLLSKRIEADAISIDGLSVNLERKADGSTNWDSLAGSGEEAAPTAPAEDGAGGFKPESIAIDSVNISNASISWSDAQGGQDIDVTNLNLTTGKVVPGEPVDLDLSLDAAGFAPDTSASTKLTTQVVYSLDTPQYGVSGLEVNTNVRGGAVPNGSVDVNVIAEGARFDGTAQTVTATGLRVRTGDVKQDELTLQAAVGGDLSFDMASSKAVLSNLSGGLPVFNSPAASGSADLGGAIEADLGAQRFVLDQLALEGSLKGDATNGESVPLVVKANGVADMGAGMATLDTFTVSLPGLNGGGNIDVKGLNDTPSGQGQITFDRIDIRKLMQIAGVSLPEMRDPEALKSASFSATIDGSEAGVKIAPLTLTLDSTTFEGNINIVDVARKAVRFELLADALDVDRYLPPAGATAPEPEKDDGTAGGGELPIDMLRSLDIEGSVRIGALKASNVSMSNMDVAVAAKGGVLSTDIRNVDMYGGKVTGKNLLDVSGDQAKISLAKNISGIAGDQLLADLGIEGVDMSGGPSSIAFKASGGGDVAAQRFSLEGIALDANLSGKSFPNKKLKAGVTGNVDLDLAAQAITTRPLKVNFAGADITTSLDVKNYGTDPSYAGKLLVAALNLKTLMKALGQPPIETSDPKALTSIALDSGVSGTANSVELADMKLKLDGTNASGRMSVADFAKPAIRFDLDVDRINIDNYTPPASGQPTEQKPASGGPATVIPVDLIRSLNIDGELRVGELIATGLKLTGVKVKTLAKDGRAVLHPLNANMYGGSYAGNIRVDASGETPTLSLDETLSGVQAGPLLQDLQGSAPVTGTANATIKMNGRGATEAQLRRTLNGTAKLNFADGAVQGINMLGSICQALSGLSLASLNTDNLADSAIGLLKKKASGDSGGGSAGSDGSTKFSAVSATVNIADGVAQNPDLDLKSPLIRVGGNGQVNLVEQSVDYLATAALVSSCEGQGGAAFGELAGIGIPVRITGPFDDLSYKPQFSKEMIASVRKAALEGGGEGGIGAKAKDALKDLAGDKGEVVKKVEEKAKELLGGEGAGKAVEGLLKEGGVGGGLKGILGGKEAAPAAAEKAAPAAKAPVAKAPAKPKPKPPAKKAEPKSVEDEVKDKLKKGLGNLLGG